MLFKRFTFRNVSLAIAAIVMLLPFLYLLIRAFSFSGSLELLFRPFVIASLGRTFGLVILVGFISLIVGVVLAYFVERVLVKGKVVMTVLLALPVVIPSYLGAYVYLSFFRGGLIDLVFVPRFAVLVLLLVLLTYPFVFLIVKNGLGQVRDIEESALLLGKSRVVTFFTITLPSLSRHIVSGLLFVVLYVAGDFGAVSLFGFPTVIQALFVEFQSSFERDGVAVLSVLYLFVLAIPFLFLLKKGQSGVLSEGRMMNVQGRYPLYVRMVLWAIALSVILCGVIIPFVVLLAWIFAFSSDIDFLHTVVSLFGSVTIGFLGTLAAFVLGAGLVFLVGRRYGPRVRRGYQFGSSFLYAIPGLVFAFGFIFFAVRGVPFLYQTMFLFVFAVAVRFSPLLYSMIRASFDGIDGGVFESGYLLGKGRAQVLRDIIMPLLLPSVVASSALSFLLIVKELPITLFLAPTGFTALSVDVWQLTEEAFFGEAAFSGLLLLLLSCVSLFVVLSKQTNYIR